MTQAAAFRALHAGPDPLILANAWDAGSARLIASLGARAIATSSAAVAWSHGYADGHALPIEALAATVREIVRVVDVPVTADAEGGYDDDPRAAAENVGRLIDAGAVGVNLEDQGQAPDLLCAKIEAVRAVADRKGVALFVNARTDVYLRRLAQGEAAAVESVARGRRYAEAGADGLFVPGIAAPEEIRRVVEGVALPVNVMALGGLPAAATLKDLGVRRLSAATGPARAALAATRAAAAAFLADGDSDVLAAAGGGPFDYNALFTAR